MYKGRSITLKHILIDGNKCIGLQFQSDRVIEALVDKLPYLGWSETFGMHFIPNNKNNLSLIFKTFRGEAWVNGNFFFAEYLQKLVQEGRSTSYIPTTLSTNASYHSFILPDFEGTNF